jgi:hypothetical protein
VRVLFFTLLIGSALIVRGSDVVQIVSGPQSVNPGPDGTLYLLGQGAITPSPGAYLQTPSTGQNYLTHFNPATQQVLYSTYLNFFPSGIFINGQGAAYLIGLSHDTGFQITPGAYQRNIVGGEEMVIAKLNPSGTAMEFVTLLGGSGYGYSGAEPTGIAVDGSGSVYVTGTTCSSDFQVTADAFQAQTNDLYGCSAFLSELNASASTLLYSTYLGGSQDSYGGGIWFGEDAEIHMAGSARSYDFPTTPGSFTISDGSPVDYPIRTWFARWNPGSQQFESIAAFGNFLNPLLFSRNSEGQLAIYCYGDEVQNTPGALWLTGGATGGTIIVLDDTHSELIYASGLPTGLTPLGISLGDDGQLTIAGYDPEHSTPPTISAHLLSSASSDVMMKLDASGSRLIYSTYFDAPGIPLFSSAAFLPGLIYVAPDLSPIDPTIELSPPFQVTAEKRPPAERGAAIYAMPSDVQQCGVDVPSQALYWDTRAPLVGPIEVHSGAPNGPVIASGPSGWLQITPSNATYYLVDSASGHILAKETVAYQPAPRCAAVPNPQGQITIVNPTLSCLEAPLTGTQTLIEASGPGPVDLHVLAADGPLFASSPSGMISAETADWVTNGMPFFLTPHGTNQALATEDAFLLPIRPCSNPSQAPLPAIQPTPATLSACASGSSATLAWYSGVFPTEIRESSPAGPAVGRFDQSQGILDVSPQQTTTYYMMGYADGLWSELASTTVNVTHSTCAPQ